MLPGPVFSFEISAMARRGRFYLVRSFYATVLLVFSGQSIRRGLPKPVANSCRSR